MKGMFDTLDSWAGVFVQNSAAMLIQSSLLILLILGIDFMLRKKLRAVFRYCLWMLVLVKLMLPATLSLPTGVGYWMGGGFLNPEIARANPSYNNMAAEPERSYIPGDNGEIVFTNEKFDAAPAVAAAASDKLTSLSTPKPAATPATSHQPAVPASAAYHGIKWQSMVFAGWLVVAAAMGLLLIQRFMFVRGLIRQASPAGNDLRALLEECKLTAGINIKRKVDIRLSTSSASPAICGLLRPVILMPEFLPDKITRQELRAVLLHELIHLKRGDLWVNTLQTILQVINFYNPLLWVANAVIRRVREQAVDESVMVAMGPQRDDYPQALLNVAGLALSRPALSLRLVGVVESKSALAGRIKNILTRPLPKSAKLSLAGLITLLLCAAVFLPMAGAAQKPAKNTLVGKNENHMTEGPAFAPAIECVINHTGQDCMVDFDNGKLVTPLQNAFKNNPESAIEWVEKNGIDAGGGAQPAIKGLIGFDIIIFPLQNSSWDMTAQSFVNNAQNVFRLSKPGSPVYINGRGNTPTTYMFKTREGGMGMLQILESKENMSTKIRYKMLQKGTAELTTLQKDKNTQQQKPYSPYPQIVETSPAIGAKAVPVGLKEIRVVFDRDMNTHGFSWCGGGPHYPPTTGQAKWIDARTCVLPVKLEKGKLYWVSINMAPKYMSFRSAEGKSVRPTRIYFCTQDADAETLKLLTPPKVAKLSITRDGKELTSPITPGKVKLTVTFDQPMGGGKSWVTGSMSPRLTVGENSGWSKDMMSNSMYAELEPGRRYGLSLNGHSWHNFANSAGVPLEPVRWTFETTRESNSATSQPATLPAESSAASTKKYTFRSPSYSLRDEPQKVPPRTLSQENPSPDDAIVFAPPIRWWASHWSAKQNTFSAVMQQHDGFERFIVTAPLKRKVWVKYFDDPVDPQKYPIVVMKYRAENVDPESGSYALYLDDTSGPDYGGIFPFKSSDIISDGKEHVLTFDMRRLKPIGDLIGLAVGVQSTQKVPAVFDLIDLRFEADNASPNKVEPVGYKISVKAEDTSGKPLEGAIVTVDAERKNWAKSAKANGFGEAKVQPYQTEKGNHMIRVTYPGMLPVELRNVGDKKDVVAVLPKAAVYRGEVVDEKGKPLPGVTVNIFTQPFRDKDFWTRRDAQVLTDENGKWQSPPLPAEPTRVQIFLSHPDYDTDAHKNVTEYDSADEFLDGDLRLEIRPNQPEKKKTEPSDQRRPGYDPSRIFRQIS